MKDGRSPKVSVGVDIVEYSRARKLWISAGPQLKNVLTSSEWKAVRRAARPERPLAAILAGKEAAFKASGKDWMGPEGFRAVRVPSRVSYQRTSRYVIATCVGT